MIYQYITNEILEREINSLYNTRHLTINSFLLNLSSNILSPRRKQRFYLTILFDETKYRNISYSLTITNNAPIIPSISKRKKVLHRKNCLHLHFLFIHIPSLRTQSSSSSSFSSSPRKRNVPLSIPTESIERIDQFGELKTISLDSKHRGWKPVHTASRFRLFSPQTIFATELKACSLDRLIPLNRPRFRGEGGPLFRDGGAQ